jgi:hypothetical protein
VDLAFAVALPAPDIAWPILVVLVVEWIVWPLVMPLVPDVPRCPVCKGSFQWSEIDTHDEDARRQPRPLWFECPRCLQTIGVPSWRKSFLGVLYLALIAIFLFLIFESRDLFLGYLGSLLAAIGAIRIVDWFIRRRLEPGRPLESDGSGLFT